MRYKPPAAVYPHPDIWSAILPGQSLGSEYRAQLEKPGPKWSEYKTQAHAFLWRTETVVRVAFTRKGHMPWDTGGPPRALYWVEVTNARGTHEFEYGASLHDTEKGRLPAAYDILAGLGWAQDLYQNVDELAAELGIEKPSEAIRVWDAVQKENQALGRMFTAEELDALAEIN